MEKKALTLSSLMHAVILGLMVADISLPHASEKAPPAIVMVDLTKLEISEKTNLPPKVKASASKKQPSKVNTKIKPVPPPPSKPPQQKVDSKPTPAPSKKQAAPVVSTQPPSSKTTNKPKKTSQEKASQSKRLASEKAQKTKKTYDINNLLASVEKTRRPATPVTSPSSSSTEPAKTGIKGGLGGDTALPLSISERDLIASKLRQCWNVNAGVEGIDDMTIELSVSLGKDGHVRSVKVLNNKNTPAFRNIAESAERAVYICDTEDPDAPFQILANKYPSNYAAWREMTLRFNPLQHSVF